MPEYEHTQVGTLMRIVFGAGTLMCAGAAIWATLRDPAAAIVPACVTAILLTCLFLFHALTVSVSCDHISLRFGIGLIRKQFALADIEKLAIVRNHWYYGWGIKYSPQGWLFNVSGFDAVEIQLRNGRKYRIGTDEPTELCSAVHRGMAGQGKPRCDNR